MNPITWSWPLGLLFLFCHGSVLSGQTEPQSEQIKRAIQQLVQLQEKDGAWPYEGVYRVRGKIPVGYRVGGSAIICQALLYGARADDRAAQTAIDRGVAIILKDLEDPLMEPSTDNRYDVRVWGHIYALDLFCRMQARGYQGDHQRAIATWIPKLTETLLTEQIKDGGWNYATRRQHAAFVTAPALQALLWAKSRGQAIDDEVFQRGVEALVSSRSANGAFVYSGRARKNGREAIQGSIARSPVCESTMRLLGEGSQKAVQASIDAFYEHWDELEKRRKKTGTHKPPYGIAPYYFYFGHRYVAQAVPLLSAEAQAEERKRFRKTLLRTKDADDTWNDRVFARSRAYGTAMAVLALLPDVPLPPPWKQ